MHRRKRTSSSKQSSTYIKDINLKEHDIEPESEITAYLKKFEGRKYIRRTKSQI